MLSMPHSASSSQVRAYSSDSKDAAGLEFGFQSLGSLFPAPPSPGRYSRLKERRAEESGPKESGGQAPAAEVQTSSAPEKPYFQSSSPAEKIESKSNSEETATQPKFDLKEEHPAQARSSPNDGNVSPERTLVRRVHDQEGGVSVGRRRERLPAKNSQSSAKPRTVRPVQGDRKISDPFAAKAKRVVLSDGADTDTWPNAKAWGLSHEDQDTVESKSSPSTSPITPGDNQEVAKAAENVAAIPAGPRLTHVKPSGEAHMVDVGDKASTKRVAIAVAHIGIKKQVYEQIVDNSNKKGDVLGIARIAGIMAAKRTADIIPLCHPLAISKAEVDVYLVPQIKLKSGESHFWTHTCSSGSLVAIQTRVECVGPTGVEM